MTDFVHLHVHSDYSLLRSAASVKGLVAKAASLGMKHLALTDYGFMSGIPEFVKACEEENINPIIGCEFYLDCGYIVLLASNEEGYRNLMKLSSWAYTENRKTTLPVINEQELKKYHEGLIGISGIWYKNMPDSMTGNEEEETALRFQEILGASNFYLELLEHSNEWRKEYNSKLVDISKRTGIPIVAANDVHYIEREDARAHSVMLCIGQKKTIDTYEKDLFKTDEFYFKSGEEISELFKEYPEAIANTLKIAERCKVTLPKQKPQVPEFEIPKGFVSSQDYLRELVLQGIEKRYQNNSAAKERAEYELDIINRMGFSDYFLIVGDYVKWALEQGIPAVGCGNVSSSIVAYALGITEADPIRCQLSFEDFINTEKTAIPDIDVNISYERRDEVIAYITEKYGKERVALMVTFGILIARIVIKDVAGALNIPKEEADMIIRLIPVYPIMTLENAIEGEPKLQELEKDRRYTELFELAKKLEGLNRHASIHSAAVVIDKLPLADIVPLYHDSNYQTSKLGVTVTQYSRKHLEDLGLVIMDLVPKQNIEQEEINGS